MSNYFDASGTIGFTCDNCGRETQGCTWVNGMKFCAKCYQETFGETDKDRKIAYLEAKLSEKEKEIEEINREFVQSTHDWKEIVKEKTQDKISFAVEQLELTLDIVENGLDDALKNSSLNSIYYDNILDKLDNQIKQLKEGK